MARRSRERVFCGHCDEYLPKSTFYRHKDTFFNPVSKQWVIEESFSGGSTTERSGAGSTLRNTTTVETDSSEGDLDFSGMESEASTRLQENECKSFGCAKLCRGIQITDVWYFRYGTIQLIILFIFQ